MQRSDRWGECVDRTCVGRRRGECVDGEPVPENSPWVCVWLGDRNGWTGDRLADLDRALVWAVIVWLNSASPAWGRSEQWVLSLTLSVLLCVLGSELSVAGLELSVAGKWIGALVLPLALSVLLCVLCFSAFFLSVLLCVLRDPEMNWSENKSVNSFPGQRRKFWSTGSWFPENCIFRCNQTCGFGWKWFPEIIFTQNKRTHSFPCFPVFCNIRKNELKKNYFWSTQKIRLIFRDCFSLLFFFFGKQLYLTLT